LGRKARKAFPGITSHGLRHSFASMAEDVDLSIPTIQALIGHSSGGSVTGGYIHKLDAALIAAADKVCGHIDALLTSSSG